MRQDSSCKFKADEISTYLVQQVFKQIQEILTQLKLREAVKIEEKSDSIMKNYVNGGENSFYIIKWVPNPLHFMRETFLGVHALTP